MDRGSNGNTERQGPRERHIHTHTLLTQKPKPTYCSLRFSQKLTRILRKTKKKERIIIKQNIGE